MVAGEGEGDVGTVGRKMGPRIREDKGCGGLGCARDEMGERVFVSEVFVIFCGGNEGWVGVGVTG